MSLRGTNILFFLIALAISISCDTEKNIEPVDHFLKYFGDKGSQMAVDMEVGSDGFIYMLGNSADSLYLVKSDEMGNWVWGEKYGAATVLVARDLEISASGSLLVLANTNEVGGNLDFVVMTVNNTSGAEMFRLVDGYPGYDEEAYSITEISDGYIVTGSTTRVSAPPSAGDVQDGFIFRYDQNFADYGVSWSNDYVQYGPGTIDVVIKAYEARPGFIYMFGYSNQTDILDQTADFNFFVFSVNNEGVANSFKFTPGQSVTNEILTSVSLISTTASSGFLLTGITESGGVAELYTMRIVGNIETVENQADLIQYQKAITSFGFASNTSTSNVQNLKAVGCSSPFGFLVLSTENLNGNENLYLTMLDNTLALRDRDVPGKAFGGIGNDSAADVEQLADGSILVLGTMVLGEVNGQKKMVLMKLDSEGKF